MELFVSQFCYSITKYHQLRPFQCPKVLPNATFVSRNRSFLLSELVKQISDKCVVRAGIHIGTSGLCMSFDAFERMNLMEFVPLPGLGAWVLSCWEYHKSLLFNDLDG